MPLRRNGPRATKILVRPPSPLASHPFITKNILRDPPSSSGIWHFSSFLLLLGDSIALEWSLATLRRARLHGFWSAAGDPRPARDPPTNSGIWHFPSFLLLLGDSIAPECSLATLRRVRFHGFNCRQTVVAGLRIRMFLCVFLSSHRIHIAAILCVMVPLPF